MSKRTSISEQLSGIIADMEDLKADPAMILEMVKKRLAGRGPAAVVAPKPVVRRKRRTKAELAAGVDPHPKTDARQSGQLGKVVTFNSKELT